MKRLSFLLFVISVLSLCSEPVGEYQEREGLWVVMQEKICGSSNLKDAFTKKDFQEAQLWAEQHRGEVKSCYVFQQSSWWRSHEKYILAVNIQNPTWMDLFSSLWWNNIPEHLTIHAISSHSVKEWFAQKYGGQTYIDNYTENPEGPDASK